VGLVGRQAELERLEAALATAVDGEPTMLLIGGDAGVGKSRLLGEFAERAERQGALPLCGSCLELGDGGLFEALLHLLDGLASNAPVVLVIEDAHWADASTRDLLVYLAHNLRDVAVLLLASYRTDDLHRQHPNILRKLEVASRGEAAALAHRRGLTSPVG
jgi:predicted ATPase